MSEIFSGPNLDSEEGEMVSIRLDVDDLVREFDNDDIISEIGVRNVIYELDDADMVEHLENRNWVVVDRDSIDSAEQLIYSDMTDSIDISMLSDIVSKFKDGNWDDKERIHRLIMCL